MISTVLPATVDEALVAAREVGPSVPLPGHGETLELWQFLASIASQDLGAARTIEPHLDALAILNEAGAADLAEMGATWGVFAAESGAPVRISGNLLSGTKAWCSLADRLDAALITATRDDGERQLFAIDLHHPGVSVIANAWHARGLSEVPSGPIELRSVPATPVGDPGWYLSRAGFAWGGIAVAACWYGGAVGVGRTVFAATTASNDLALIHLGAIDELLESSRRALSEAAALVDAGAAGTITAKRVRATIARATEEVILRAGHALGPAPLALDARHSKRIADLELYVRQHHAEADQRSLGRAVLGLGDAPW